MIAEVEEELVECPACRGRDKFCPYCHGKLVVSEDDALEYEEVLSEQRKREADEKRKRQPGNANFYVSRNR